MHKRKISFILIPLIVFCFISIIFYQYKHIQKLERPDPIVGFSKFMPKTKKPYPVLENKKFVIIIPSYNNDPYCEKNLLSVFEQEYDNYRVIYIDDASSDNTYEHVKKLVDQYDKQKKVTLIHNTQRCGGLCNTYRAIHSCSDEEIILTLDGDDWFSHNKVLKKLNEYYANPNIWIAWSHHLIVPDHILSTDGPYHKRELEKNDFRHLSWRASHLRSFYAKLFKKIPLEDFLYEGKWYITAWDMAFMFPMIEMANPHFAFIPDIFYIYNRYTPFNEDQTNLQRIYKLANHICSLPPKKPINLWEKEKDHSLQTECVILAKNSPIQLYASIESIKKNIPSLIKISVLYEPQESYKKGYQIIHQDFPDVLFIEKKETLSSSIQTILLSDTENIPFILLTSDNLLLKTFTNIRECSAALEQTQAISFYIHKSEEKFPESVKINDNIYAGQALENETSFIDKNIALFRKKDLMGLLKNTSCQDPKEMQKAFFAHLGQNKINLFFADSKALCFDSINRNQEMSPENKFEEGYKINIAQLTENSDNFNEIYNNLIKR
jgi:glycosyltransferase involved in cell wall biosynthesis